jgi:DUF1680 family protein
MKPNMLIVALLIVWQVLSSSAGHAHDPEIAKKRIVKAISTDVKALPFSLSEVVLNTSWIQQRELLNTKYLHQIDPDRLLHNFRVNAGLPSSAKPMGGWESPECGLRGHFVGHYLSACAMLIKKEEDAILKRNIGYLIDELAKCQDKMGGNYLSAFPESDFDTLENQYGGVWAPYYTFHKLMQGLLDVYIMTENPKAYQMVLHMADYVKARMDKLSETEIEKILYTAEANPSNEAGGMNEVLHNLYAISKNPEHLKLAKVFDRKWFSWPLMEGKDILSGLHSNTHIVLVNGYARRFENTRETDYQAAVRNFWEMLIHHHTYANGSSSGPRPIATTPTSRIAEHWGVADHLSATLTGEIAESCVTHNTQKLTANLFCWTADAEYADVYQNTFYNAVLPVQNEENGQVVYHLPLGSPRTKKYLQEEEYKCCNGSGIEAFAHLNANIYFHNHNNLWVNLFIPSEVSWKEKGVRLQQITSFPEEPKTTIKIAAEKPVQFALKLLIPSWANERTKVLLNGKIYKIKSKPVSFVTIDRKWTSGDQVELVFNYDFQIKSMPDNPNVAALFYGPVMLAFETNKELILKGSPKEILQNISKQPDEFLFTIKNNGTEIKLVPFYKVTKASYGVYATFQN